jgi:hypothetical protein
MPRSAPPKGKVSSVADRIRGSITAVLFLACFTLGATTHSAQWQLTFIIAGVLYLLTTLGMVFEHADGLDQ